MKKNYLKNSFTFIVDKVIDISLVLYLSFIEQRVKKSYGRILLRRIKNRGKECKLYGKSTIMDIDNLSIGDYVHIGEGAFIFSKGGVEIGSNTQISRNVTIYSCNHDINGNAIPYDNKYVCRKVTIGESVWIGMNVSITPGVSIGNGAVIGMGAVVSRDVAEGEIVVGSPQRIIGYRDMDLYNKKLQSELFFGKIWLNN